MSETKITPHMQSFVDKFVEFSARLANQVHLRSLRDAFATVMPIFHPCRSGGAGEQRGVSVDFCGRHAYAV